MRKTNKTSHKNKSNNVLPENWTIITAFDRVATLSKKSQLSDKFWESCESPLAYLCTTLGISNIQAVLLAILMEDGSSMAWRHFGFHLDCSSLLVMAHLEEMEELVDRRWLVHKSVDDMNGSYEGYEFAPGVIASLSRNKVFVPEKIDGLTEQQFIDKLESHVDKHLKTFGMDFKDLEEWMLQMAKANSHLPLCREALVFDDIHDLSLLFMMVFDYAKCEGTDNEGLTYNTIDRLYPDDIECGDLREFLLSGMHILMACGLIEYKCDNGQVDKEQYVLTRKAKEKLLSNYKPSHTKCSALQIQSDNRYLKSHTTIKEKQLFFNDSEQEQIQRLTNLLSTKNLPAIQERLEEQGMRKGFACLFYGSPGTGKTETVLQIARQTGRDLMQVDISNLRDKFVGESEKNVKEVFNHYREICEHSEVMPILFFNEADAIINKRTENIEHAVDKTDNAIQNIILQEPEDLDGILIATTNLTSNLDKAFERRFLFKIEFHKPDTEVKAKIWNSMLKDISTDEAHHLASHFDFSGGQIENIARKRTIDYVLSGKFASLHEIETYCHAELLTNNKTHRPIGFKI